MPSVAAHTSLREGWRGFTSQEARLPVTAQDGIENYIQLKPQHGVVFSRS